MATAYLNEELARKLTQLEAQMLLLTGPEGLNGLSEHHIETVLGHCLEVVVDARRLAQSIGAPHRACSESDLTAVRAFVERQMNA